MELEDRAGTIFATTMTSRPNIYNCCPIALGGPGKLLTGMTSGPKFTVMLSIMCCSALHITHTGRLTDNGMNTPVRDLVNLLKLIQILKRRCNMRLLKGPKDGEDERKRLLNPSNCCTFTPGSARRPPVRVMWSAEQHIMDSSKVNFGRLSCLSKFLPDRPLGQQM